MTTVPPAARPPDTNRPEPQFPDTLQLTVWVDPLVDAIGYPPHHAYVELTGRVHEFDCGEYCLPGGGDNG